MEVDIFATSPIEEKKWKLETESNEGLRINSCLSSQEFVNSQDNLNGYYDFVLGEIIDDRYKALATHGHGVFSTVLRAYDLQTQHSGVYSEFAIKVIHANETMTRTAHSEKTILNKLALTDPESKQHIIKMFGHFNYRNHACIILESMDMNLRTCVKKFGRDIGLNIHAVRAYVVQLMIALKHLKSNSIIHADIKPDNILVNETRTTIKLCDFGSAIFKGDNDPTPYLFLVFIGHLRLLSGFVLILP